MTTTDEFQGFKKLYHFPKVALAVSKTDKLEVGKVYEAPAGWHWGSTAEVAAIMGGGKVARQPTKYYYHDQGGWEGATWGGVERLIFVFSDTLEAGGYVAYSEWEGRIQDYGAAYRRFLPTKFFAGIVCVAD